uniref:Rep n=1 Tax=Lactuca sativa CRESS virus TaxID=2709779 RepID=A0A6G8R453_9VIRU|nr:MAG: Rep [Lactuca sativa CRESS virus]
MVHVPSCVRELLVAWDRVLIRLLEESSADGENLIASQVVLEDQCNVNVIVLRTPVHCSTKKRGRSLGAICIVRPLNARDQCVLQESFVVTDVLDNLICVRGITINSDVPLVGSAVLAFLLLARLRSLTSLVVGGECAHECQLKNGVNVFVRRDIRNGTIIRKNSTEVR